MNIQSILLNPIYTSGLSLSNRVVMAPMNRRRASRGIPSASTKLYYGQRAGAGLIITDNVGVTPNGIGYLNTPGIYNDEQQQAWKLVADEVHARGSKIFMQLVHSGRIGHPLNYEGNEPLVAPSAVRASALMRTPGDIYLPMPEPKVLSKSEMQNLVEAHIKAAIRAVEAGFNGVEIHGAHGVLTEQFMNPLTNKRTDEYGGSIENRSRFLLEIIEGVSLAIGKERTGVRLSPFAAVNELEPYADEKELHMYLAEALGSMDILYIHLSNQITNGRSQIPAGFVKDLRKRFPNLLIQAGGYDAESAEIALQNGEADLIAFGKPFISNPDLVEKFRRNAPLAEADPDTFYEGDDKGYIDYPVVYGKVEKLREKEEL